MDRRDRSVLVRLTAQELEIIAGGAAIQSRKIADFVRGSALDRARELLDAMRSPEPALQEAQT